MNIKAKILYYLSTLPSTLFEGERLCVDVHDTSAYGCPAVQLRGECSVDIIAFLGGTHEEWYGDDADDRLQRNWTVTINIGDDTVRFDCIETAAEASRRLPVVDDSSEIPF